MLFFKRGKSKIRNFTDIEKNFEKIQTEIYEIRIIQLYTNFLNRQPANSEIQYYLNKIKSGKINFSILQRSFMNSTEGKKIQKQKLIQEGIIFLGDDTACIKIDSHNFYFDSKDMGSIKSSILNHTNAVKNWKNILEKIVTRGMNVIDIGANIGLFALLLAELVNSQGKIYAFEPNPKTESFLRKNIEYNHFNNVEPFCKAVTNYSGTANLKVKGHAVGHYLTKKELSDSEMITVDTITIDDFVTNENTKVDFIFMDAEGSEENIMKGMVKTLKNNPNLEIITEFNPTALYLTGTSSESFLNLIESLGFSFYIIHEKKGKFESITKQKLLNDYKFDRNSPTQKYTNLYLKRQS